MAIQLGKPGREVPGRSRRLPSRSRPGQVAQRAPAEEPHRDPLEEPQLLHYLLQPRLAHLQSRLRPRPRRPPAMHDIIAQHDQIALRQALQTLGQHWKHVRGSKRHQLGYHHVLPFPHRLHDSREHVAPLAERGPLNLRLHAPEHRLRQGAPPPQLPNPCDHQEPGHNLHGIAEPVQSHDRVPLSQKRPQRHRQHARQMRQPLRLGPRNRPPRGRLGGDEVAPAGTHAQELILGRVPVIPPPTAPLAPIAQ